MQSAFGFKSNMVVKGKRLTLAHECECDIAGANGKDAVSAALKASGDYAYVTGTTRRYGTGRNFAFNHYVLAYK